MISGMDWHAQNIKVYNESAQELAERFSGIGSRVADIERALKLADKSDGAKVVEIGCGDGRDAVEIVKHASMYQGFDPSIGLLNLAKFRVPSASFVLSDASIYNYPDNLDAVFAFASLLHISKDDLPDIFKKIHKSLRSDGILYISLKERDEYAEDTKVDQFGTRMFYFYNPSIIKRLAGDGFSIIYEEHYLKGKTPWFNLALKKV